MPKPIEELYDTEKDPWELENLADLPQYAARLKRMRMATETWQETIGDTGLVPEAVLMEEMKPGGKLPTTEPPEISVDGKTVSIKCPTEGASIVYQTKEGGGWGDWLLYRKSLANPGSPLRAQACRLGFRDSEIVELAGPRKQ